MTPEQKIATVLKQIKDEAAINPDSSWMKFDFNYRVVGAGILSENEERRILFKLEKEGVIKLRLSQCENTEPKEVSVISSVDGERYLTSQYYWVEILEGFEEKYQTYSSHLQPIRTKVKKEQEVSEHETNHGGTRNPSTFLGDYIAGDKIGRDKKIKTHSARSDWLGQRWLLSLVISILAIVIGYIITAGELPKVFWDTSIIALPNEAKTLDRSIFQLVEETDYAGPILNVQKKWKEIAGFKTKDERATIVNYGDANLGKTWVDLRSSSTDSFGVVTCIFANGWRQKIELIGTSDREVIFRGTIRGDLTQGQVPILDSCRVRELTDFET